jgi:cobalamin biosynthesis Mg chelatase CobN
LDTSVIITYKDGSVETYASLEEASAKSGLSESAIKIRCNKSRDGSTNKKDKINCKWVSDTTFRSYQAKKSKSKGSKFEADVVNRLKELGYDVCRAAAEAKSLDNNKVDVAGDCEFAIQCKNTQNLPNYFTIREACTDPRPLALLWKKVNNDGISPGTLALIPIDYFFELLSYYRQGK